MENLVCYRPAPAPDPKKEREVVSFSATLLTLPNMKFEWGDQSSRRLINAQHRHAVILTLTKSSHACDCNSEMYCNHRVWLRKQQLQNCRLSLRIYTTPTMTLTSSRRTWPELNHHQKEDNNSDSSQAHVQTSSKKRTIARRPPRPPIPGDLFRHQLVPRVFFRTIAASIRTDSWASVEISVKFNLAVLGNKEMATTVNHTFVRLGIIYLAMTYDA